MKLSIVIPAFNEEKLLPATLAAVQKCAPELEKRGILWEIVVCDNNSTDGTAAIARAHGAKVIFEPKNQISRARNTGASLAEGNWLLFLDADSTPSPPLFADLATVMQDPDVIGGGCTLKSDQPLGGYGIFLSGWNCLSRIARWAAGSFVFCRTEAFHRIGGFSEKLYASEEVDFSQRLKKLGRSTAQHFRILHRYPLVTSARKLKLYQGREYVRFILTTMLRFGKNLRDKENCPIWYDGRR